jgi:dUTP pyrophosphatase
MHLKVYRLRTDLPMPAYMTPGSSGIDLLAAVEEPAVIPPGMTLCVPTGIAVAIPSGYEGQVRPRSGLALREGVTVLNTPGTIDADYRGEVGVILINHGTRPFRVERGMRIAQMILAPVVRTPIVEVERFEDLESTERSTGGFGHTGV